MDYRRLPVQLSQRGPGIPEHGDTTIGVVEKDRPRLMTLK